PAPLLRQHRLYQADWLMRFYGFSISELVFDDHGHLPMALDPKMAWAMGHPEFFPLEIMRADYEKLLRVPGIGPISAKRIAELRRSAIIADPRQLTRLGVVLKRAAPYLLLHGRPLTPAPLRIKPVQLDLWSPQSDFTRKPD
ncbi:MAG: putative DNA modification/repair radical SAM protein, partial [Nitrospirae bacterium]|nr:putative DNA modification/repair radical SAM protein [Nitrospirota bacterium]